MLRKTLLAALLSSILAAHADENVAEKAVPEAINLSGAQAKIANEQSKLVEPKEKQKITNSEGKKTPAQVESKEDAPKKVIEPVASANKIIVKNIVAPKQSDIDTAYPKALVAIASTISADYETTIKFTPNDEKQTIYFDSNGTHSEKASDGGFYRIALGKTASGRIVVQDFYQQSKTPQTAPFLMIDGGDLKNFDTAVNDGLVIWYDQDGDAEQAQLFDNGVEDGPSVHFTNGSISALLSEVEYIIYHKDSETILSHSKKLNNTDERVIFFRPDGSAIYQLLREVGRESVSAWDKDGNSIDPESIKNEVISLEEKPTTDAARFNEAEKNAIINTAKMNQGKSKSVDSENITNNAVNQKNTLTAPKKTELVSTPPKRTFKKVVAPKQSDIGTAYPKAFIAIASITAAEYKSPINFTFNEEKQTIYFDSNGTHSEKASDGGFYRIVLGKTALGRIVVQDFYQQSKTPQTAPFLMVDGGDLKNFDTAVNDGLVIWYDQDGDAEQAQLFDNGENDGPRVHFTNGSISAQLSETEFIIYHKDSDKILSYNKKMNQSDQLIIFFRFDGSAMYQIVKEAGENSVSAWDTGGNSIDPKSIDLKSINGEANPLEKKSTTDIEKPKLFNKLEQNNAIEDGDCHQEKANPVETESITGNSVQQKTEVTAPLASEEPSLPTKKVINRVVAPKQTDFDISYPEALKTFANTSSTDYKSPILFTPSEEKQTIYFDSKGELVEKASDGGYYRNVLGKTETGRIVAQDFYQQSKTPQTAPFLMTDGGDLENFDTVVNDGLIIWYNPNGETKKAQFYDNGEAKSARAYFKDGGVSAQTVDETIVVYHKDSKTILSHSSAINSVSGQATFFRPDGSAVMQIRKENGKKIENTWDQNGNSTDATSIKEEVIPLLVRTAKVLHAIRDN